MEPRDKHLMAALEEQRRELEKFKLAVDSATDQIVIADNKGVIVYANPTLKLVTGYTPEEAIGTKAGELWGGLMPKSFYQVMWDTISRQKKPFKGELRNRRKNGEEYDAQINVSPILDEHGEVAFFVAIERDITPQKDLERLRADFLNIAAHDLRTPTTAIKGFVQMIRHGEFGPAPAGEMGEALADIEEGADRMIDLVNDFLTIARLEQGRIRLDLSDINVKDLVESLVRQLNVTVEGREVQVVADVADELPLIRGDSSKIAQVITNLADNALKHTAQGTVTISARPYLGKYVEMAVADTGTGIAPKDVPHIFERYYKGEKGAVATGRGGGLGLGLHIVKLIIDKHGGRVWADSVPGKGATFHFTLPVVV